MKNIFLIAIILLLSFSVNSQRLGLEGKRFSVELDFSSNLFYLFEADRLYSTPQLRTKIHLNYTVARKHSISLISSTSIYNLDSKFLREDYQVEISNDKLIHFGIGIRHSVFVRDFISPVGSTFSYFVKRNSLFINNGGIGATSLAIGISYESRIFISSKMPIYINYGFSSAFNFLVRGNDLFIKTMTYVMDGYLYENQYNIDFKAGIYFSEIIDFNVGIGYVF